MLHQREKSCHLFFRFAFGDVLGVAFGVFGVLGGPADPDGASLFFVGVLGSATSCVAGFCAVLSSVVASAFFAFFPFLGVELALRLGARFRSEASFFFGLRLLLLVRLNFFHSFCFVHVLLNILFRNFNGTGQGIRQTVLDVNWIFQLSFFGWCAGDGCLLCGYLAVFPSSTFATTTPPTSSFRFSFGSPL